MSEPVVGSVGNEERFGDGPVVVFTWRNEPGWPVEYVSPNIERLFGYSPEEFYENDRLYAEIVHDEDLERVTAEVKTNSEGSTERFNHEPYRVVTRDGDVRWVLDYTRIVREDGDIVGYTGYIVDITERKAQIEYVNALNATIRSLQRALIDAGSREEINHGVCDALADLELFAGTWIGTVDFSLGEIVPVARSGVEESYLDSIPMSPDATAPSLAVRVAFDRPAGGIHAVPGRGEETIWHEATLSRGYRSVFAVPIQHRDIVYGALTVYGHETDTFDSRIREILLELGALVGYAITAVERRNALYGSGSRDLLLEVAVEDDDPLRSFADRLSGVVEVRSVSQRNAETPLLYCLIPDIDPGTVIETAESVPGLRSIEHLSDSGPPIYRIVPGEACVVSKTTALGVSLRSIRFSERSCELAVSVRRERDQRRFLGQVRERFGGAELKAERDTMPSQRMPWAALLTDTLTERQLDVLKTAYYDGYFDEHRKRTGSEIAESLGMAQPTFARHMRAAQRNLLSAIWDYPEDV
jgi:PAS domain S-box-containing protein